MSAVTCLSDMVAILSCSIMITYKLLKIAHYKYIPVQETRKTWRGLRCGNMDPGNHTHALLLPRASPDQ